jgi:hypothetical protein
MPFGKRPRQMRATRATTVPSESRHTAPWTAITRAFDAALPRIRRIVRDDVPKVHLPNHMEQGRHLSSSRAQAQLRYRFDA